MFDNGTMLTNGGTSYSSKNGVFAYDPLAGFLAVATNVVFTFVGCASTSYLAGDIERGEDLHARAELAYTRMAHHLLRFRPRCEEAAKSVDQCLAHARTELNRLWSLHQVPA
jgi:hypothetical protein